MNIEEFYEAQRRLQSYLHMTPLIYSALLNRIVKKHVWLKLETQLPTGSFKPRPAFNSILSHLTNAKQKGVIASSSGNFAQAVAFAARELELSALIVMTEGTSPFKIERTKALGAEVVLCENSHQARLQTTLDLHEETGRVLLNPYDSVETIAGDGTIGLELSKQLGDILDHDLTVVVPVSGGGLIAGIAFVLKHLHPSCKIIGVQPENNGSLLRSFQEGKCVFGNGKPSIADALGASSPGFIPFDIIKQYVDDVINISEKDIIDATTYLIEQHKLVVEPGGSLPVAALMTNQISAQNVVCIASGGNIALESALLNR